MERSENLELMNEAKRTCALKLGAPDLLFVDIISVVAGRPLFGLLLLLLLLPPLFFFLVRLYKTDDVCKPLQTGRLKI